VPDSPRFLVLRGRQIVGHLAASPVRVRSGSDVAPAHWVVGFMVLPEYRNGLVGPLLIKKANETLDLAMTLHVEESALRVFKGLGWTHAGVVPQYARVLNGGRLMKSLRLERLGFLYRWAGPVGGLATARLPREVLGVGLSAACGLMASRGVFRGLVTGDREVREESAFDDGYDRLWERVGGKFDALVVRDREYLTRRYDLRPDGYRLLACRRGTELVGYCVVRVKQFDGDPRMGSARVGTLVDCLFDPADRGRGLAALIGAATRLCRKERADVMFCTASHRVLRRHLVENGFVRVPGSLQFAYRDSRAVLRGRESMTAWHIMRGDSDGDQNL
jgi:GNAT superfamily N-acetyltransferase